MHVKSLKIFCDVVGRRSFSRAADENGISQSGASQVVQQLEQRLGVKLIDRSKRPFVLTPEGEAYYRGCRTLVQDYLALEEEVRTLHQEVDGLVRVASIYSVGLSHMNRYIQEFLSAHPKANVRLEYQHPDTVYDLAQRDQVDFGLVSYPKSSRTVKAIPWREEPMVLACAPTNPLADRGVIELEQLDGANVIGFDTGLRIRTAVDRALAATGTEVKVVMEFDNIETIKRAIEIDAGVGILPEPTVQREAEAGTLVIVPLIAGNSDSNVEDGTGNARLPSSSGSLQPAVTRPLGIIHRRGKRLGATARWFVSCLQENAGLTLGEESDRSGRKTTVRPVATAKAETV